jgi:hypothetical protein
MTDSDEIDELREQTRGKDRISAAGGTGERDDDESQKGGKQRGIDEEKGETEKGEAQTETEDDTETPTPSEEFERAFEDRAGRTESGIDPRTVSATDPALSALLLALQETDELDDVGGAIADELGAPAPPEYDRDAVVRLAVAYALSEAAPEYFDHLAERA